MFDNTRDKISDMRSNIRDMISCRRLMDMEVFKGEYIDRRRDIIMINMDKDKTAEKRNDERDAIIDHMSMVIRDLSADKQR